MCLIPCFSKLESRINQLQGDLARTKQELGSQQAEQTNRVSALSSGTEHDLKRKSEVETDVKLQNLY